MAMDRSQTKATGVLTDWHEKCRAAYSINNACAYIILSDRYYDHR